MAEIGFSPAEAAYIAGIGEPAQQRAVFYELWTLKEACTKALGLSLVDGLRLCRFVNEDFDWCATIPTGRSWHAIVFAPRTDLRLALVSVFDTVHGVHAGDRRVRMAGPATRSLAGAAPVSKPRGWPVASRANVTPDRTTHPDRSARTTGRGALYLGLSYPILAHTAVLTGRPALIASSVAVLVTLILLQPLSRAVVGMVAVCRVARRPVSPGGIERGHVATVRTAGGTQRVHGLGVRTHARGRPRTADRADRADHGRSGRAAAVGHGELHAPGHGRLDRIVRRIDDRQSRAGALRGARRPAADRGRAASMRRAARDMVAVRQRAQLPVRRRAVRGRVRVASSPVSAARLSQLLRFHPPGAAARGAVPPGRLESAARSADAAGHVLGRSGSSSPPIVPTPAARAKSASAPASSVAQNPRWRSRPSLSR